MPEQFVFAQLRKTAPLANTALYYCDRTSEKVLAELIRIAKGQRVKRESLKGAQLKSSHVKPRVLQDAFALPCFSASQGFSVLTI